MVDSEGYLPSLHARNPAHGRYNHRVEETARVEWVVTVLLVLIL